MHITIQLVPVLIWLAQATLIHYLRICFLNLYLWKNTSAPFVGLFMIRWKEILIQELPREPLSRIFQTTGPARYAELQNLNSSPWNNHSNTDIEAVPACLLILVSWDPAASLLMMVYWITSSKLCYAVMLKYCWQALPCWQNRGLHLPCSCIFLRHLFE